jgi:aminopeptidase
MISKKASNVALINCLNLKKKESLLIVYDNKKTSIAKNIFNVAKTFSSKVKLLKIKEPRVNGQEPLNSISFEMKKHDVIMLITTKSLSHTKARRDATKTGTRIASMPGITTDMFNRTMSANYNEISKLTKKLSIILTKGKFVKVTTKKGTNVTMSIKGRKSLSDALITKKKDFSNLPSGESCLGPVEGTTNGTLIVDASFLTKVDKPIKITFEEGYATNIVGGKVAKKVVKQLNSIKDKNAFAVAELGIGTNNMAKITGNILEDEKVKGTAHIALGNNKSYGGKINVPIHLDAVFKNPTIYVDNKKIIDNGNFLF